MNTIQVTKVVSTFQLVVHQKQVHNTTKLDHGVTKALHDAMLHNHTDGSAACHQRRRYVEPGYM